MFEWLGVDRGVPNQTEVQETDMNIYRPPSHIRPKEKIGFLRPEINFGQQVAGLRKTKILPVWTVF